MSRILGLDLGTNSIGWAMIDNETVSLLNSGMRVFKTSPKQKVKLILIPHFFMQIEKSDHNC